MNDLMKLSGWQLSALGGLLAAGMSVNSHAERVLYAIDNEAPFLSIVDPATGVETHFLELSFDSGTFQAGNGLAVNPLTNEMYAAIKFEEQGGPGRNLVKIDPRTGLATDIGNMGQPIAGMAFDSAGTLYAVSGDCLFGCGGAAIAETLFTVDLEDASLTLFKTLGNGGEGEAVGFNPVDGMMYHMSGVAEDLIFEKIDLGSGVITPVPLAGDPVGPYETIGFTYDIDQNLFLGSLIDCLCNDEDRSFFHLTADGTLNHVNTLPFWWKDYAFFDTARAGGVLLDLEALSDVNESGAVDAAIMVGRSAAPTIKVYVRDGATGDPISETTVLNDAWQAIDFKAMPGAAGSIVGVLAQRGNGEITVAMHRADDGSFLRRIDFFSVNWAPKALAYVSNVTGSGGPGLAVLAKNINDNRVAVQLRRRSDGKLLNTAVYFRETWQGLELEVLDDLSGNGRPEIAVLGRRSRSGRIDVLARDARTREIVNRRSYFGQSAAIPAALTMLSDVGAGPAPELPVLAARPDGKNFVQIRDALTGDAIDNVFFFGSRWDTLDVAGLGDINGNSSADLVVIAQHRTNHTIRADVRDAATGTVIRKIEFLGPRSEARAFAVFDDIDGNGVQELGVLGRRDDGAIQAQLRDAESGVRIVHIAIP